MVREVATGAVPDYELSQSFGLVVAALAPGDGGQRELSFGGELVVADFMRQGRALFQQGSSSLGVVIYESIESSSAECPAQMAPIAA